MTADSFMALFLVGLPALPTLLPPGEDDPSSQIGPDRSSSPSLLNLLPPGEDDPSSQIDPDNSCPVEDGPAHTALYREVQETVTIF